MESEGLTLENLYNCDETGLCYKMLPTKTIASRSEKEAPGMKKQKDRVTLMACANATTGTHKFPLMFIGKAANPRCFKQINKNTLPATYYNQKIAWVDTDIFTDWFNEHFMPSVTKHSPRKDCQSKLSFFLTMLQHIQMQAAWLAKMETLKPCIFHLILHLSFNQWTKVSLRQ